MSDILTPEEVDALLKGVSSGDVASNTGFGVPSGEVRELDLTNPDWFRQHRVPPLDFCNQVLARQLKSSLRPMLKNQADATPEAPRLETWADYTAQLPQPTYLHPVSVAALETDVLFVLNADLILSYVDFYYGGDGVHESQETLSRDFTVTELRVAGRLQQNAAGFLRTAWAPVAELTFEDGSVETNPAFANFFNPADVMAVSRFNVSLGERSLGWLDILIPNSALEPRRAELENIGHGDPTQKQSRWAAAFATQLKDSEIEVHTLLGSTTINLGELVKLRIGDILPLELPTTVELTAGSVPLFRGTFGISNGHNAVRIIERLG
ncbi:MAG: flagellar motor switch protein FliM [Pseudomonadales bacterium]